ncbi:DgyrCDS10142 [Dimorphilus gyrociliatus]|uniref:DgyrCDS10142 n=1 Tax=Dimorphilus gyrociliatus TaxID=2664684 RepID=A0A7I8VZ81_9ANNE|nr:DgyrCDS10142 [Dimorphilus gyrociliatus]
MVAKEGILLLCANITFLGILASVTIGPIYHIIIWRENFGEIISYKAIPEDVSLKPYEINKTEVPTINTKVCIVTSFIVPKYQCYMIATTVVAVLLGGFGLPFGLKYLDYGSLNFKIGIAVIYDPSVNSLKVCGDYNNPHNKAAAKISSDIRNEEEIERDPSEINNISRKRDTATYLYRTTNVNPTSMSLKKVHNFKPFFGQHCETTAVGCLLKHLGIDLSEPMLFGIGEGLNYMGWRMKSMDTPFFGGRPKPDGLLQKICENLNLKNQDIPVGLKLDCYHLDYMDYMPEKIHFGAHYATIFGYDETDAYMIDTAEQKELKTKLKNLELARSEKAPMSSKNKSFIIEKGSEPYDLKAVIKNAIYNNAKSYLNPPISNMGYKGILKSSTEIKKWFKESKDVKKDFGTLAMLMERAGTGGAVFRNMYRDFLLESYELLGTEEYHDAYIDFKEISKLWTQVAQLFEEVAETEDVKYIDDASKILITLSEMEKNAMETLFSVKP